MKFKAITVWTIAAAAGLTLAAGYWLWPENEIATQESAAPPATTQTPTTSNAAVQEQLPQQAAAPTPLMLQTVPDEEASEDPAKMFTADASGNLVLQESTRLNVEKLLALYTPAELQQKLGIIEQTLPASAYRQMTDLLDRYKNYNVAQKTTYPPGSPPATVEDAITQHEGLHALRVAHFGAEATEAMYGRDEKIGRQLLEFMNLEKHEGMTMEEKAEKAQQMLANSPELAEAYERNRTAGKQPN